MLAEWTGLEPATPGVTGRYSNQLNYHSLYGGYYRALDSGKRNYTATYTQPDAKAGRYADARQESF